MRADHRLDAMGGGDLLDRPDLRPGVGGEAVDRDHGVDAELAHDFFAMHLVETVARHALERVLLAVDCANESRIADPEVLGRVPLSIDVDHHHDNTRFGRINLIVADASSTGEVLRDLFRELNVELTPEIAEALYIALVTDTGRFQYTNTTPKALRLAAELVEAGADVHRVFQGVYESVQFAKLKLLARALGIPNVVLGPATYRKIAPHDGTVMGIVSHSTVRTSPR